MNGSRPTQRVRVTSSRRGAAAARRRPLATALAEQTDVGELYLRGLLREQLRLSLTGLAILAVILLGMPVLFALVPATRTVRLAGVPLPWLLMGVLIYPAMVGLAAWYDHHAHRLERRFADVVTRER